MLGSELVGEATVTSLEEAKATALLAAARSKSLAEGTIGRIDAYLQEQAKTDALLQKCTVPSTGRQVKYAPVIHIQKVSPSQSIDRNTYVPEAIMQYAKDDTDRRLQQYPWQRLTDEKMTAINQHFEENLSENANGSSPHDTRVRDMARRLFNADAGRAFNYQN